MEMFETQICRFCSKQGFIFCDVNHEAIQKFSNFIPNLININDESLLHISKVCTTCYQTVKNIVYNLENIRDTQKILKIENLMRPKVKEEQKLIFEDIAKKYTNLNVKKIQVSPSTSAQAVKAEQEKPKSEESPPKKLLLQAQPTQKLVIIEAIPESSPETSTKNNRSFMCITCSQKFHNYEQMQVHLKSCQISSSNLKCFCGKVLRSKKELGIHVFTQHKQHKQNHVCKICNKLFTTMTSLNNHMSMMHNGSKLTSKGTLMCHYCKGKFLDLDALEKHRKDECCGRKVNEM
ncbi:unnamed protein product [Chironomus riparius]|uniref:C2H2-type domain-containing protein n=1 Tax=Chironomus riparius TaxID=315576 RepID=A0A9N9RPU9_9DIPT|nr:unnamed protein product [Chironomus riparius]